MTEPASERLSVFIDADVLIAGSSSTTGASHLVLMLSELDLISGVSSEQVRNEVERNLANKLPEALGPFRVLADAAIKWVRNPTVKQLKEFKGQAHQKDLPILVAAIRAGCHSLITFNVRDFHPKGSNIEIEAPGDFLARLRQHISDLQRSP